MKEIAPKSYFPRSFFNFPSSFPAFFEGFENELPQTGYDSGLQISEDDSYVYVEAKMPGLNLDDIEVNIENGILKIQGERKEEEKDKEKKYHRKASYSYSYRVSVPMHIDESSAKADYTDGVTTITFAKSTEGKGKKIKVKKG